MITAVIYDRRQEELKLACRIVKDIIACRCGEESRIGAFDSRTEVMDWIAQTERMDFACVEVSEKEGTEVAERIRKKYPEIRILLIADVTISPAFYIRPAIMASALILRPVTGSVMRETMEEFMESFLDRFFYKEEQDVFVMETREGITRIPYRQIYYYEASMKKVLVRLKEEEYSYYNTLERLAGQLPEYFIRCHRSFIVNRQRIARYDAPDSMVVLDDRTQIPVSRSYRSEIRDLIREGFGQQKDGE